MPLNKELKKVMVVGSGPIIIGQAAEFDYAGTQACRALREEGLEVVLINSNPATIMTDSNMADRIYIEPLTLEFLTGVIAKERPDGIVPGLGGQVGLNLAKQLAEAGVLDKYGVRLLGTPLEAIKRAEDRDGFKTTMESIGEPIPESAVVETVEEAVKFAETIGFPLVVRPAYTLGGTGGGMVYNMEQLEDITNRGLGASIIHQALIEKSLVGWKELEFEVMRDNADNCITICSMENIDPMGVHTGDSIVVAPTQTLSDREYQMLRSASLKIIRALGVAGGCNVQFALDPDSYSYYVIEVNPRVSRSSALASKATGYPIAKVSTKIAIGFNLDEIKNTVTGQTYACFEPSIDYAVVKFPRWPFDKFTGANRVLGTQMKATGEVMSIDRTLEGAFLKAVRSLEIGASGLSLPGLEDFSDGELDDLMVQADDRRFFLLAEALRRGMLPGRINKLTGVDMFFLGKLQNIIATEKALEQAGEAMDRQLMLQAKKWGFADSYIAQVTGLAEQRVKKMRQKMGLKPVYKMVDTCAAEFEAVTPYYYSCYDDFEEVTPLQGTRVVVLGSGPIRIGQGIEFDYCNVHSVWALREEGIKAITVNNNPETVSTDFDTSDRLYFEPLLAEDVLNILDMEKPMGVIVQFGGQTPINLAAKLHAEGIKILGTSVEDIDRAEDRERFDRLLIALRIPKPPGRTAFSVEEAVAIAGEIGYPVLVRPSYVLGGRAMEIVYNHDELLGYMATAVKVTPEHPVLVDKYLMGVELELDAIADGETVLIPGIMRHVERAGVHSGDSIAVYPTNLISQEIKSKLVDYSTRLALALNIKGMINIQYVLYENEVYVLEVNPRASRTVPYMSKITGIPMVNLATKAILGKKLKDLGYQGGLYTETSIIGVKAPVFSFAKLTQVDVTLGPEMKSTGEVMGVDRDYAVALYKALVASGHVFPREGTVLVTVSDKDKDEVLPLVRGLASLGYNVCATSGTADFLTRKGLQVEKVNKLREASPNIADFIRTGKINLVLNTLTKGKAPERDGFKIRRAAVENGVPCLTSMDTAWAILEVLTSIKEGDHFDLVPLQEYRN